MDPLSWSGGVDDFEKQTAELYALFDSQDWLDHLRAWRGQRQDSVYVLNFRPLQARRIEILQRKVLRVMGDKHREIQKKNQGEIAETDAYPERHIDIKIDHILHDYGTFQNHPL